LYTFSEGKGDNIAELGKWEGQTWLWDLIGDVGDLVRRHNKKCIL